ncbi:hypothetical protein FLAG1_10981 [Fusarium langsethiae]|uniref:Uncharacterized protein n=1 Tax=Fusarium langsethiae TaxID=179993 RepID=A0A0N0DB53_FUSLA|nr:hypothetical protein FLAG1_10981 [Fusarium langsethiae]GKU07225.1 unnamed protein product [Fusarium langsethiae]GKU21918.1 unnamed protein product [Fusarium langsethiae]
MIADTLDFIPIYGNHDSASFSGRTRPFPFPQPGHLMTEVDGFFLCRYPNCKKCAVSPEFVPIHFDCYSIFIKECLVQDTDALRRLWVLSAWRTPWRGARPHLSGQQLGSDTLKRMSEMCGLPELCRVPRELLEMIRGYSRHSLFWRCISAIRTASCVTRTAPEPHLTVQLSQVLSWKRSGKLECITSTTPPPPIIRLTIDSDGISRVERLSCTPIYSGECNNSYRSVVQHASLIAGIEAQIKDGLLRLKLPYARPALPMWNTPAPPDLSSCRAYGSSLSSSQHFHAVEADRIRGITFFFSSGQLFGIHVHNSEESSAIATYERFSRRRQRGIIWIYLPISKNDRLLVLGVRQGRRSGMNILIRTRHAGDIIIGQHIVREFKDMCLGRSAPVTIVYGEPREGSPVTFFGAYCKPTCQPELPKPFPLARSSPNPLGDEAYYSWASLDRISSTLTFNDRETGFCKGIMFQYQNGGCRTVGQCRWHLDLVTRVEHPDVFRFRTESYPSRWDRLLHAVRVKFQHHSQDERADEGWKCQPLKGFVQVWFTSESTCLAIESG